ncbi:hypothetical protein C8R45DRAFT_947534 [Mycena sanguinolenta]|nr:hypothetical protein C8R45DRAFT_947534 [Mycena sanguinolenta]
MSALLFSDLAPDVIFSIFACCDISSVVSTCRYLHALAFDKSVWLGLLHNLQRRGILDQNCTPSLETLSTNEMVGVVRRLLTGPQTWSPQNLDSDCAPEVTKTITLHPIGEGNIAKLLPSGRYILFHNCGSMLECWNVTDDKMVWRYTTAIEHAQLRGDCQHGYSKGTQNCLLTARAPDSGYDNPLYGPVIYGKLAAVNTDSQHMILNWATQSYLIVDGHSLQYSLAARIALIPEHVILMNCSLDRKDQIHLISNDALSAYLVPIITLDDDAEFSPILAEDIPKRGTFEDTQTEQSFDGMHVHESPLREGDYRLWIHGLNYAANTGGLFSCTLSIPNNGEPQWCRRSRSVKSGSMPYTPVSYSGHSPQYSGSGEYNIFSAASPAAPKPMVRMPGLRDDYIGLAAYSGALTYSTRSSIVFQYYK